MLELTPTNNFCENKTNQNILNKPTNQIHLTNNELDTIFTFIFLS